MDLQDLQDDRRSDLKHGEITEKIIGCAFEVINELGTGLLESVYEKAMSPDTNKSINELRSSCTSCPSMFIHIVRKLMIRCLLMRALMPETVID